MRQSSILLSSILWSAPCNNHLSRRAARGMRMAAAPPAMLSDSTPMQTGGGTGPSVYFVMGGCAAWATPPQNPPTHPPRIPPPPPCHRRRRRRHRRRRASHGRPRACRPGSGKGTQCALLSRHFGMTHLSAGDLLREEVASGSDTGQSIERIITAGKIVPSDVTVGLLQAAMAGAPGPFLIDGFPRSLSNLHAFDEAVGRCAFMLFLELGEAEMESRLIKRGATSGRSDDNAETIRKRFRTFNADSMPVIEELQKLDAVRFVSADGSVEEVFQRVLAAFAGEPLSVV